MHVFVTGGTGFIGRALVLRLRRDGHSVLVLTRDVERARAQLGDEADLLASDSSDDRIIAEIARADAIVNLAGAPLVGSRWTEDAKQRIRSSRVDFTQSLVRMIERAEVKPKVLVSASAVGYYGDTSEAVLHEDAPAGSDFLAQLCVDWEDAAMAAARFGVRTVTPRLGVVLGREDGALAKMLPAFRAGLGGPVGTGRQFLSWIHIDDLVELFVAMIQDDRYSGPVNATAPTPVHFAKFADALAASLSRPSFLKVPAFVIKLLLGEASTVLLHSQRALPGVATRLGFRFRYWEVMSALADLLDTSSVEIARVNGPVPDSGYLDRRSPRYVLSTYAKLSRPINEVFDFFCRPENLGLITPPGMHFRITRKPSKMKQDATIHYRLRLGPIPISWTTRIEHWEERRRFVDSQSKGPYACWWHEHRFGGDNEVTEMHDRVFYSPPAGVLGAIANRLFIDPQLRRVFAYRAAVMRRRFG